MKKTCEYALVYAIGAVGYSIIEILWRGFTHWSMGITGGVCFLGFHVSETRHRGEPLIKKCLRGCSIITVAEFLVGCVVNIALRLNVWDYSGMRFNILGQICPFYSGLWFALCIPMTFLSDGIRKIGARIKA
ncbi:MAG: hypothetical protein RSA70_04815 [Clostridia bacterium]